MLIDFRTIKGNWYSTQNAKRANGTPFVY